MLSKVWASLRSVYEQLSNISACGRPSWQLNLRDAWQRLFNPKYCWWNSLFSRLVWLTKLCTSSACNALGDCKTLEILELTKNKLTSSSVADVTKLLTNLPAIQCINLNGNVLGEGGCKDILLSAFASTSLRELCLPCTSYNLSNEAIALNTRRKEQGLHELKVHFEQ